VRAGVAVGLIVLAGGVLGAAGFGGDPRPALHRSARPVWCPSVIFPPISKVVLRLRDPDHSQFDARGIVGLKLAAAEHLAGRNDCTVRVVNGGGALTMDLQSRRIDVDVQDGIVTGLDARTGGPIG
jgi:hypothetical protein